MGVSCWICWCGGGGWLVGFFDLGVERWVVLILVIEGCLREEEINDEIVNGVDNEFVVVGVGLEVLVLDMWWDW